MPSQNAELVISTCSQRQLALLESLACLTVNALSAASCNPSLADVLPDGMRASRLYFGNEFCEHLLPTKHHLEYAVRVAKLHQLTLGLVTPIANDTLLDRLCEVLPLLADGTEVVANDWGVVALLHDEFPNLIPVGGRQLSKQIKDPRILNNTAKRIYPSSIGGDIRKELFREFGIRLIELDMQPMIEQDLLLPAGFSIGIHVGFSYIAKGRICKVGGRSLPAPLKFAPGSPCKFECLSVVEVEDEPTRSEFRIHRRGTTIFFQHNAELNAALKRAISKGLVQRLIVSEI